jgi:hypothetical protein
LHWRDWIRIRTPSCGCHLPSVVDRESPPCSAWTHDCQGACLSFAFLDHTGSLEGQIGKEGKRDEGLQIDLLVRPKGQVLTLIECKFTAEPIGVSVIDEVARKIRFLKAPSQYTVERVLISAGGLTPDLAGNDYFHQIAGLDAIFA